MEITWSLPHTEGSPRESPRPTAPASPSTTLSDPQGAGLRGPAASSNSSYVPCHQLLCASRLPTPARHIRSYPIWVKSLSLRPTLSRCGLLKNHLPSADYVATGRSTPQGR